MRAGVLFGAAAVLVAGAAEAAGPVDLFYERTLMRAADQRCRLFDGKAAAALAVAAAQAESAAVRAGVQPQHLARIEARARSRAAATACAAAELQQAAERVRQAFEGWSKTVRITFPGAKADWRADRTPTKTLRWRLVQASGVDRFGVAGQGDARAFVAVAAGVAERPYAARLVVRDPKRDPKPWLAESAPPVSSTRAVFAEAVTPAERTLLSNGEKTGFAVRFPAATAEALKALDPRESFTIEYLYAGPDGRDRVRRARFEVGDFAAAEAFLAL